MPPPAARSAPMMRAAATWEPLQLVGAEDEPQVGPGSAPAMRSRVSAV
jgi:hypothetical protein